MAIIDNIGYSTQNNKWETLTNKELVKHDLLLNLYTRRGECDWNVQFGTTIMDKIFQTKTEQLRLDIMNELQDVFNNEPRIELHNIDTISLDKGWQFTCTISYLGGTPEEWIFPITEDEAKIYSKGYYN